MNIFNINLKNKLIISPSVKAVLKDIKKIVFILMFSFLFLVFWVNRIKFYPENIVIWAHEVVKSVQKGEEFPYKIDANHISAENFKFMGNNLVILSDTSVNILNPHATVMQYKKHNFSNPAFKTKGIRTFMYDVGGKNYSIESSTYTIKKASSEKNIISCALADNGVYSILTESQNYLSELSVYNQKNAEKYTYCFSEYYMCDTELDCMGTHAAVCGISAENENINSRIYILNFKSEKPEAIFNLENNVVMCVKYFSNGNILAVGDKYLSVINGKSGSIKNFYYEGRLLKFYDFKEESGVCCCFSSSLDKENNDEILMIDVFGNRTFGIFAKENLKSISYCSGNILTLSNEKLTLYGMFGTAKKQTEIKNGYKKTILTPGSDIYMLKNDTVDKLKANSLNK